MRKLMTTAAAAAMTLALSLVCTRSSAQITKELVEQNPYLTAGVHHPYITSEIHDTPAPKGFKPFYVTHYGRHGSRYQTSDRFYRKNTPWLVELGQKGLLTPKGEKLRDEMIWLQQEHKGVEGTLTARGGFEQQGVAERLYDRCPEIFRQKDRKVVTSRSTNVHRVIQSMGNFNLGLKGRQPDLQMSILTGDRYWDVLCHSTKDIERPEKARMNEVLDSLHEVYQAQLHPEDFFTDLNAVRELTGKSAARFEYDLFVATHILKTLDDIQGHDPLSLFSTDDLVACGRLYNCELITWFIHSKEGGICLDTTVGRPIVRDMLRTADAAIAGNDHCADLRFGHDSGVAPLLCLLQVGDYAKNLHIWEAPDEWPAYRNLCMCTNVQLIFYRNRKGEVLVKVLHNEQEVLVGPSCPVYSGPYYRWEDMRAYLESRLTDN